MDPRLQAIEVIHHAEGELRNLLLRSAEFGDYETARLLAEWAKQLKQMAEHNGDAERQPQSRSLLDGQKPVRPEEHPTNKVNRQYTSTGKNATRKTRRKAARGEYPKFLREGEELLKIGWSKRTWATYRHKAPKRILDLVAQALLGQGKSGTRFAMEEVLPIRDPKSTMDVPSYQAYLILAWLRKEKMVVQHGREGYSLKPGTDLVAAVQERWGLLPES
jgi:hypothetical protein